VSKVRFVFTKDEVDKLQSSAEYREEILNECIKYFDKGIKRIDFYVEKGKRFVLFDSITPTSSEIVRLKEKQIA
jgi:hypothetical protein